MKKLTNQSKKMVLASVVVTLCIIGASMLFIFQNTKPQNPANTDVIISVILIITALILTTTFFILRMRRSKHSEKLNEDFFSVYEKISCALNDRILSMQERKMVLADILDLFLQAQRDKRPVSDVTGINVEQFVKDIRLSYGNRSRLLYSFLNGIAYCLIMILLVQALSYIEGMQTIHFFEAKIDISTFIFLLPLTLVVLPLVRNFAGKSRSGLMILLPIIYSAFIIGFFSLLRKTMYNLIWVRTLLDGRISVISSWEILILWLAVILGIAASLKILKQKAVQKL